MPGDFAQLRFSYDVFGHTPVIVEVGSPPSLDNILVAAHSQDADYRPLSTYVYQEIRFIHILGTRRQQEEQEPAVPSEEELILDTLPEEQEELLSSEPELQP